MSSNSSNNSSGSGLCGAVFIVFLVLKLIGQIDWSWWWVTAPLWIPFGLVLGVGGLVLLVAGVVEATSRRRVKKILKGKKVRL